jgi:1,4-dihydroxy-2-naphthoate octaprenyltransferase
MDQGVPGETSVPYTADVLPSVQAEPYEPHQQTFPPAVESYEQIYPETVDQPARARWFTLLRPQTLLFGAGPVVVVLSLLWAQGARLAVLPALSALLAATLVLAGAIMLDEYLDYERFAVHGPVLRGVETPVTLLETTSITPLDALRASLALIVTGAVVGLPAVVAGGPLVLLLGMLGVATAFLYSATSYSLKRLPAGELVVALALGPGVVVVTLLSQHHRVNGADLLLGAALGLFALAQLEVTHLRDAAADRNARRMTLVVLLGERGGRLLCALCFLAAYLAAFLVALQPNIYRGALATLLSASAAVVPLTGALRARAIAARQLVVGQTFRAYAYFILGLALGFVAAGLFVRLYPSVRLLLGF